MSGSRKHELKTHSMKKTNINTSKEDMYEEDQKLFKSTLKNSIEIKAQE